MFEKEAEEYIKEHTFFDEEYGVQSLDVVSKTIFKDGAEFGYNKANEWHDLRKNPQDLPKGEGTFLVAIKYPAGWSESFVLEYTTDEDDEKKLGWWYSEYTNFDSEYTNFDNEVYAWREIPKPPKGDDA